MIRKIKNSYSIIFKNIALFFTVLFMVFLIVGCENYPKSETEALNLYAGKFWTLTEFEVQDLYINGKLVKDKAMLDKLEDAKKIILNEYNISIIQKNSRGELWEYYESYDKDINSNYFSISYPNIIKLNDRYVITYPNSIENKYRINDSSINSLPYEQYNYKNQTKIIQSISENELKTSETATINSDNNELKISFSAKYKSTQPQLLDRYKSEFKIWESK